MIHSTVLPNGLRVVIAEQAKSPIVSAGVFVRQGSRNENSDENGISHFLEHMLYNNQRAIKRNKHNVRDLLDNGGILNAHTTKECTSYEGIALTQHADLLFRALYELIFEAEFTEDDVDAERKVILAELKRKKNGSDQIVDYLVQGIYGDSGYGNWILGTESFISTVTAEYLLNRYHESYVADNVALVIQTGEDINAIMSTVNELFGRISSGIPTPVEVPMSEQIHLKVLRQKSEQVIVCLGGIAPSLRDEEVRFFEVGLTAWGSIPSSRLFMAAREQSGLVYQIQSFYHGYVQTGQWGVFTTVSKDKFQKLIEVLGNEIQNLFNNPISESELLRTTSVLKTNLFSKMQNPDYFLRVLGRREVFRESVYPNDLARQYELATPERVKHLMQNYIRPLDLSLVVMGDIDGDQVLEAMNRIGG